MTRSLLRLIRNAVFAILLLALIVCGLEIGMRVDLLLDDGSSTQALSQLIEPSWQTHHRLKPMSSAVLRNPDTAVPVEIRTNSWGLRSPEPALPKPDAHYRILCLGNEQTLAATVTEEQSFCRQLQHNLQQQTQMTIEVVNGGVPGQSPLLAYLQTKRSLMALQPDLIILNFDMSDVSDDRNVRKYTQMDKADVPLACIHPALKHNSSDNLTAKLDNNFMLFRWGHKQFDRVAGSTHKRDSFDIFEHPNRHAWLRESDGPWSPHINQALTPIKHLQQLSQQSHMRFILATYPVAWQASPKACRNTEVRSNWGIKPDEQLSSSRPFDILDQFAKQNGISICDTSRAFLDQPVPETLYQQNAPWFSQKGHQLYAQVLSQFVINHLRNGTSPSPSGTPNNMHQTTDRNGQYRR